MLAGVAYVVLVLVGAFAWGRLTARRDPLADVNAVTTPIATVGGLYWFAHHTATVDFEGQTREWPWLPWWIAAAAVVVLTATRSGGCGPVPPPAWSVRR